MEIARPVIACVADLGFKYADWRRSLGKVVLAVVVLRTKACRAFDTDSAGYRYTIGLSLISDVGSSSPIAMCLNQVYIHTSTGVKVKAAVPSGASTDIYDALELRDGGSYYLGNGVSNAVGNVNSIIAPALIGKDPIQQIAIENSMVHELDGTQNEWGWCKQKLEANANIDVSLSVCKSGTWSMAFLSRSGIWVQHIANLAGNLKIVLSVPANNVINAGSHAENKLTMQEFMNLPVGASSFKRSTKMGVEVYHNLKKKYDQDATNIGDGGFAPNIQENKEGFELLKTAIEKDTLACFIGMDVTASEFYSSHKT